MRLSYEPSGHRRSADRRMLRLIRHTKSAPVPSASCHSAKPGFALWQEALGTGADLVWRIKRNMRLSADRRWPDGSYESRIYASQRDWRHQTNGVRVRVVDYRLEGVAEAEPIYRLVTSILE